MIGEKFKKKHRNRSSDDSSNFQRNNYYTWLEREHRCLGACLAWLDGQPRRLLTPHLVPGFPPGVNL